MEDPFLAVQKIHQSACFDKRFILSGGPAK
jgi:hypothetical protein